MMGERRSPILGIDLAPDGETLVVTIDDEVRMLLGHGLRIDDVDGMPRVQARATGERRVPPPRFTDRERRALDALVRVGDSMRDALDRIDALNPVAMEGGSVSVDLRQCEAWEEALADARALGLVVI